MEATSSNISRRKHANLRNFSVSNNPDRQWSLHFYTTGLHTFSKISCNLLTHTFSFLTCDFHLINQGFGLAALWQALVIFNLNLQLTWSIFFSTKNQDHLSISLSKLRFCNEAIFTCKVLQKNQSFKMVLKEAGREYHFRFVII